MDKAAFYQSHLNRVSRSFALCIAQLHGPLRERVALSYILCRLIDTIEDSNWPTSFSQLEAFRCFNQFLEVQPTENEVQKWVSMFPKSIPQGEQDLLDEAFIFFGDFHTLDAKPKLILYRSLMNMSRGMLHFTQNHSANGQLTLTSLQETNQYCFFVAGVVGELLTEVFALENSAYVPGADQLEKAVHFGLFLQKVNLLKDQMDDCEAGRFLVFDRDVLRGSLLLHAENAFRYLLSIPMERTDFRVFCAWSLFLGLKSMPYIDRSWAEKKRIKISRLEAFNYLSQVQRHVGDEQWLKDQFSKSAGALQGTAVPFPMTQAPWLVGTYQGALSSTQLASLAIIPHNP